MSLNRFALSALLILLCSLTAFAQRPGPQFRRPLACEPVEPRTKLEELDWRYGRVLVKGFTQVANFAARGVDIRIDAVELKEPISATRATGLVISLRELNENGHENRSFVDYEDIDRLLKALDVVSEANESITKLASFEARYRTPGDLEVTVFRQSRTSGTAASITTGICDRVTALITLDDLERFKAHIVEAKTRLNEIK